ncbi:DUF3822 family protein [Hanstruepera ponticola]|uniref:DUF3822 family protein n=1 Tax=Hanstruepera ponticola TaxID=2042995 RepID=UPI001E4DD1DD|nr:DUF3822 family protein [Hanstruepera ponticola]
MKLAPLETGLKPMVIANNISEKENNLELSIQISLNGLSFCVLNKKLNTITFLKPFYQNKKVTPIKILDTLINAFESETELQKEFKNVLIIHDNELSTFVPKNLFDSNLLADYLKFNSKILKSDFIAYDEIKTNESVNVYVPYVNINNYIYEKFGAFSYKHISTILVEKILEAEKYAQNDKVYVHVEHSQFNIVAISKGNLILYNSFEYNTKEDLIYYLLFTLEQLGLNPESIDVILLGDIKLNDNVYDIIYKYIRHVSFGTRFDDYKFKNEPASNHSNFPLIHSF